MNAKIRVGILFLPTNHILMNKAILILLVSALTLQVQAQNNQNKTKTPAAKPAQPKKNGFKNLNDSASYVIGYSIGLSSKALKLPSLDTSIVAKAFNDGMQGTYTTMDERTTFQFLNGLNTLYYNQQKDTTNSTSTFTQEFLDSASYALGVDRANFMKHQGITSMNVSILKQGLHHAITNKPSVLGETKSTEIMNKLHTQLQLAKVQPNIDAGTKFLAENKKKPGVKTTKSGLQYEVIKMGTGIRPAAVDTFVAHYRGTLLDGTEFDASYNRGQPLKLGVGQVIKGWTEGLQLMPVGSKFKFYIPYNLGYGVFDNPPIPGGSMLIFEVELLDVKKN